MKKQADIVLIYHRLAAIIAPGYPELVVPREFVDNGSVFVRQQKTGCGSDSREDNICGSVQVQRLKTERILIPFGERWVFAELPERRLGKRQHGEEEEFLFHSAALTTHGRKSLI